MLKELQIYKNRARPTNQLPQAYNSEPVKFSCFTQTRIRWAVRSLRSKRGKNICSRTSVSSHRSWLESVWLAAHANLWSSYHTNREWSREQGTFQVGENNSPSNFSVRHIWGTINSPNNPDPALRPSLSLLLDVSSHWRFFPSTEDVWGSRSAWRLTFWALHKLLLWLQMETSLFVFLFYLEVICVVGVRHQIAVVGALKLEAVCDASIRVSVLAVAVEVGQTFAVA